MYPIASIRTDAVSVCNIELLIKLNWNTLNGENTNVVFSIFLKWETKYRNNYLSKGCHQLLKSCDSISQFLLPNLHKCQNCWWYTSKQLIFSLIYHKVNLVPWRVGMQCATPTAISLVQLLELPLARWNCRVASPLLFHCRKMISLNSKRPKISIWKKERKEKLRKALWKKEMHTTHIV